MPVKLVYLLIAVMLMSISCASSQEQSSIPKEYSNLVELKPADGQQAVAANLYVDSVKVFKRQDRLSLLVMGNFPDGCTNIGTAQHQTDGGNLSLTLEAWRNPDRMCTQALVAFSFIYDQLPEESLKGADSVRINGTDYPINL